MLDKKFVPQFNITLRCNMYNVCPYCYVKEQKNKFPLDMKPQDFSQIVGLFKKIGVNEVIFLGGEPAMHPQFSEFLEIIKKENVSGRLFSNGTYNNHTAKLVSANEHVRSIFFHYEENYLEKTPDSRKVFINNLKEAKESNKKIWLRWNIDKPDMDDTEVIDLAKEYCASIGYSISLPTPHGRAFPIPEVHLYANSLIKLIKSASSNNIEIEPARALPLCAFTDKQLEFLKKKGNLQGDCVAINDITVNTDLSLQLCSVTHSINTPRPKDLRELNEKIDFLKKEELKLKAKPAIAECVDCKMFLDGSCQGGA